MPADPRQLAALAQAARASQGTPQDGAIPAGVPDMGMGDMNSLLLKLRSGGMSAGALLQLLALLAGMGGNAPQQMMGAGPAPGGDTGGGNPIEQAMMGQGQ